MTAQQLRSFVEPVASIEFREAMAQMAAAVHVITTGNGVTRAGLTASAVTSLSASPPTILACLQSDSRTLIEIERNGVFCVNVLSEHDQAVAEVFAGRVGLEGELRFQAGVWDVLKTGAPALVSALNALDCRLVEVRSMAANRIVIGEVLAIGGRRQGRALIYRNRRFDVV